jgi:hypothetical protein
MLAYGNASSTSVRTDGRTAIPAHGSPESMEARGCFVDGLKAGFPAFFLAVECR